MKKQIVCIIMMILLIFTLCCGCQKTEDNKDQASNQGQDSQGTEKTNNTDNTENNETNQGSDNAQENNTQENNAANKIINAYKEVLSCNNTFYSTDDGKDIKLSEMENFQDTIVDKSLGGSHFAVMDLDGDLTPEIVIEISTGSDESLGFEILRYTDDKIYGYSIGYRAFNMLKADGTFNYANSAFSYGYGTLQFNDDSYSTNVLAYTDLPEGSVTNKYFIGDEEVTEEKFAEYEQEQLNKEDVFWYEFSDENFTKAFENFANQF